jgi:hypothetical protein
LLSLEWQSGETEPQHRETVLVQANEEHATIEVGTRPSACQIFNGTSRRTPIFVQNNTKMSQRHELVTVSLHLPIQVLWMVWHYAPIWKSLWAAVERHSN